MYLEIILTEAFKFRWSLWFILAVLYFVPLFRVLTFYCSSGRVFVMRVNRYFGFFERSIGWFRNTAGLMYLLSFIIWNYNEHLIVALLALFLIVISFLGRWFMKRNEVELLQFICNHPDIHPDEFFDHLLCCSGVIRHHLPDRPRTQVDLKNLDFHLQRKASFDITRIFTGALNTIWLARLVLLAGKVKQSRLLERVASSLSVIWGTRLVQLAEAKVVIEGSEHLSEAGLYNIYLFNHLSFLDFALVPIVMAVRESRYKRSNIPVFLVAKKHFIDNPIFFRLLGIGLVAKALGMVFVERKGNVSDAKAVVDEASKKLVRSQSELAIFPQGTRAYPRSNGRGERIDGGYFVVGSSERVRQDGGHLKKGAAYIAVQSALSLSGKNSNSVSLFPIAIKGTGVVAPRGSIRIQTGCTIHINVGSVITVASKDLSGSSSERRYENFVSKIHLRIDESFESLLMARSDLERRFFEDMRKVMEPLAFEELAVAIKPWREKDSLVHAILDCIYTCHPELWHSFLGRLAYLICHDSDRRSFLDFKAEVVKNML